MKHFKDYLFYGNISIIFNGNNLFDYTATIKSLVVSLYKETDRTKCHWSTCFFWDKPRPSPSLYGIYISSSLLYFRLVSVMACNSNLLRFWLLLNTFMCCQSANKDECIYQGDDGTHSFFMNGDVILGGLFPLHYSPVLAVRSFQSKPEPTYYK